MHSKFRISQSPKGYRVELCRNGEPYVTFLDGLTRERAERGAHSLTTLWGKISTRSPRDTAAAATGPVSLRVYGPSNFSSRLAHENIEEDPLESLCILLGGLCSFGARALILPGVPVISVPR